MESFFERCIEPPWFINHVVIIIIIIYLNGELQKLEINKVIIIIIIIIIKCVNSDTAEFNPSHPSQKTGNEMAW